MPIAIITEGNSTIVRGIGSCLIADGWEVVLIDHDLVRAGELARQLGIRARAESADVTDLVTVEGLVDRILQGGGEIGALVNVTAAAVAPDFERQPFCESEPKNWARMIGIGLEGAMNCIHAVLPPMMAATRGAIVSLIPSRPLCGEKDAAILSGTASGLLVFSQSIARETGAHNIRVNTIIPGPLKGDIEAASHALPLSVLGRPANATDVGNMVSFLLSEKACHVTGSCFDLSGGVALH